MNMKLLLGFLLIGALWMAASIFKKAGLKPYRQRTYYCASADHCVEEPIAGYTETCTETITAVDLHYIWECKKR